MKKLLKNNYMFIAVVIMVLLAVYISNGFSAIGENPFADIELNNPVSVHVRNDRRYYISDDSSVITVTDENNELIGTIEGGSEDSFSSAAEVEADGEGNIYVHDKQLTGSGAFSLSERIVRFSGRGGAAEVLYETDTVDETGKQTRGIKGLSLAGGRLSFVVTDDSGISVFSMKEDGGFERTGFFGQDNAFSAVSDAAIGPDGRIAYSLMNGDVYVASGQETKRVYAARDHDTEDYFSIISELDLDDDGTLYLCDIGLREVYRLGADGETETVIHRGRFAQMDSELFSEQPQYQGLDVSDGVISVTSAEYMYDRENDEEIYFYSLGAVNGSGETVFNVSSVSVPLSHRLYIISVYAAATALAALLVFAAAKAVKLAAGLKKDPTIKLQLVMVGTALAVTCCISYIVFDRCNDRFINEAASKLTNAAYLIGDKLDASVIRGMDSPDDYFGEGYSETDAAAEEVLNSKVNRDSALYCVIYGVKNDIVCELYRDGAPRGTMYPMAGRYGGSIEEYISENNDYDVSYKFALAEGTYMYSLVPVYDDGGECIAFVETGTDYNSFNAENRQLYIDLLMLTAMTVIIVMLMISEFICGGRALREKRQSRRRRLPVPPEVIRPLSFMFFFVANLSTAFLPIYGKQLWNESFPLSAEIAAALPLSAEMILAAAAAFAFGFLIRKTGVRLGCVIGAGLYIAGSLLSAFAGNLYVLICANALCGIGSGVLSITFNTWAAGYDTETERNKGFIHINAAYLAGLNCGTVIGSLIWEYLGITTVYIIAAVCALILGVMAVFLAGGIRLAADGEAEEKTGSLRELFTPRVIRYFVCISAPYLICTAFLEYFFPLEAEASGLSGMYISMAFLLSGLISIYTGSSLAEPITAKMGTKKAMIFASFLYAAALFYLVFNPSVYSCYIVVIMFAAADSFGLSAQSVYYSSLPEAERVGQSKALGVNDTVESITSACGSLIFGAALMLGTRKGIFVIALCFALLTVVFAVFDKRARQR